MQHSSKVDLLIKKENRIILDGKFLYQTRKTRGIKIRQRTAEILWCILFQVATLGTLLNREA